MVSFDEIEKNDFNLNLPRYIDSQQTQDLQDIEGHLNGGIPERDIEALGSYWSVCPQLRHSLFKTNRLGYVDLAVDKSGIKAAIYDHPEFVTFISGMNDHFASWRQKTAKTLKALEPGCHPKAVISKIAEELLAHYLGKPLMDPYAVYQHLLDYWAETMQDDCYSISADGWKAQTARILEKDKKGKEKDKGWACDLVPKALIVARYFAKEQTAIDQISTELETTTAKLAELEEEHGGDEGAFSELEKVNKAEVTRKLREIKSDKDAGEEATVLNEWLERSECEADLKRRLKDAETALDAKAFAQYPKLTEAEIKTLVVDDKWLAALDADIHGEMARISHSITERLKELAERYENRLPDMIGRMADLGEKVNLHLKKMGFSWN
jgi:type I restriction enzyme M protein